MPRLEEIMKKERYNCSTLAKDSNLSRFRVYKIIKGKDVADAYEIVAISKTLKLKIGSVDDLKEFFLL